MSLHTHEVPVVVFHIPPVFEFGEGKESSVTVYVETVFCTKIVFGTRLQNEFSHQTHSIDANPNILLSPFLTPCLKCVCTIDQAVKLIGYWSYSAFSFFNQVTLKIFI